MRKKYRVEITARAEHDIADNVSYIAADKASAAIRWAERLEQKLLGLETVPTRHAILLESRELGVEYRK